MLNQSLALMGLTLSLSANAAIINLGNVTRDTSTGLDWLDVTETRGLSYNDVTAQMGAGGAYEGWRYASASELDVLIGHFGYSPANSSCAYGVSYCDHLPHGGDNYAIERFIKTLGDTKKAHFDEQNFGVTFDASGAGSTYGLLGENVSTPGGQWSRTTALISDNEQVDRITLNPVSDSQDLVMTYYGGMQISESEVSIGSFLVMSSVSEVPLPAAGWLFGSAIFGLAVYKRKK